MYSAGNVSGIRLSPQAPPHASGKKEKRTPWGLCFFASQNMWSLVAPRFVCPPAPLKIPALHVDCAHHGVVVLLVKPHCWSPLSATPILELLRVHDATPVRLRARRCLSASSECAVASCTFHWAVRLPPPSNATRRAPTPPDYVTRLSESIAKK
jgi:hypothetical protein